MSYHLVTDFVFLLMIEVSAILLCALAEAHTDLLAQEASHYPLPKVPSTSPLYSITLKLSLCNAVRKKEKYVNLINEMSRNYRCVRFVNLSMSSLGVFSDECSTFLDMMNDIGIDKKQQRYIIKKMINIAIGATYYIFCCRNRNWDSPDLMQF